MNEDDANEAARLLHAADREMRHALKLIDLARSKSHGDPTVSALTSRMSSVITAVKTTAVMLVKNAEVAAKRQVKKAKRPTRMTKR